MDIERKGLPSASSMDRYHRCDSSLPLESFLRSRDELPEDIESSWSSHGTRIHAICASMGEGADPATTLGANEEEIKEADEYWQVARMMPDRVWGSDEGAELHIEKRLFLNSCDRDIATGAPDLVWVREGEGIIVDYKTGFGALRPALDSYQLKLYAAMASQTYSLHSITTVFVKRGKIDSTEILDRAELETLIGLVFPGICMASDENPFVGHRFDPDPETCRYCPCRLKCPALNTALAKLQMVESPNEFLPTLPNWKLEEMKDSVEALGSLVSALDAEMDRRATDDPCAFNKWHLAPGRGRRVVVDPGALCQAIIDTGAEPSKVLAAVKIGLGDAERLYRVATGTKGAVATSGFKQLSQPYVESKEGKISLQRRK